MGSQPQTLTSKPLRTSNDTIFPSLNPFGPFYGQRNLLQKRTSDVLVSKSTSLESSNKLHVASQPGAYKPVKTLVSPQEQPIKTSISRIVPQRQVESKPVSGFGLGLPDIWGQLLGVNPIDKVQANLMMEIMKQQMNVLADQALQQIVMGKVHEFSSQAKSVENLIAMSDSSSTVESENEEEMQFTKENQSIQVKQDQKLETKPTLVLNPLQERQLNGQNIQQDAKDVKKDPLEENNIIEKTVEKITMMIQEQPSEEITNEPEETGMTGFDDKIKTPVPIDIKAQAVIPGFKSFRTDEEIRRVPKLIWTPEEEKIEEIKTLLVNLSELLGCEITHEQKAWRVYQRYEFSMERCLEIVGRQKNKYKADFKYKRSSNKKLKIN